MFFLSAGTFLQRQLQLTVYLIPYRPRLVMAGTISRARLRTLALAPMEAVHSTESATSSFQNPRTPWIPLFVLLRGLALCLVLLASCNSDALCPQPGFPNPKTSNSPEVAA